MFPGASSLRDNETGMPMPDLGVKIRTSTSSLNLATSRWLWPDCRGSSMYDPKSNVSGRTARLPMSPFGSIAKTGTPASAAASTTNCDNTVFPDPVAPKTTQCLVRLLELRTYSPPPTLFRRRRLSIGRDKGEHATAYRESEYCLWVQQKGFHLKA